MLTIILTRHGETELSEPDRYLGRRIPASLNEGGRQAAQALGRRLESVPIDRVISSPLERAQETARLIVGERGIDIDTDERLIEFDYGGWEGMTTHEVSTKLAEEYALYDANPAIYRPGGGENGNQAAVRATALVDYLLDWWGGVGDRTVLLVGHSSINRVLLAAVTGVPMSEYRRRFLQEWANLTVLQWESLDSGPLLVLLNDMAHNKGVSGKTWS